MKETEKRMKYYNLSKNIIACDNFLPNNKMDELFTDFLNNREKFKQSIWHDNDREYIQFFGSDCGGLDFWLDNKTEEDNNSFIESLHGWLINKGIFFYTQNNGSEVYKFLERKLQWDIHVICYNNGGYYNWHKDAKNSNIFTFNLILNKSNKLKGGDMFFMDDNKIIEVKNKNNFMVVFPSYISHSISPLYTDNNKDVSFLEQRFSIQFWTKLQ